MNKFDNGAGCTCRESSIEHLEMTVSYLMSRFAVEPNEQLVHAILHHLEMLIEHVDHSLSNVKRKHYAQLFNLWWVKIHKDSNVDQMVGMIRLADEPMICH